MFIPNFSTLMPDITHCRLVLHLLGVVETTWSYTETTLHMHANTVPFMTLVIVLRAHAFFLLGVSTLHKTNARTSCISLKGPLWVWGRRVKVVRKDVCKGRGGWSYKNAQISTLAISQVFPFVVGVTPSVFQVELKRLNFLLISLHNTTTRQQVRAKQPVDLGITVRACVCVCLWVASRFNGGRYLRVARLLVRTSSWPNERTFLYGARQVEGSTQGGAQWREKCVAKCALGFEGDAVSGFSSKSFQNLDRVSLFVWRIA